LPEGPDAGAARLAVTAAGAYYAPLIDYTLPEDFQSLLQSIDPQLLLTHPRSRAGDAALFLGIPVANVLRHFEAGIFTLESVLSPSLASEIPHATWKPSVRGVPLVLIASGFAYRQLANRLDASNPVIGITPPSLEHLPLPHTIEHIAAECVRMLRRSRPKGPYGLAGWETDGLVALEMARLLEEQGDDVVFVAMLDPSRLLNPPTGILHRVTRFFRRRWIPSCDFMAKALRQYRPRPWYGKILRICPAGETACDGWFEWNQIAPHGLISYEASTETLPEILAAELCPDKA
jgi:hypothetical protein